MFPPALRAKRSEKNPSLSGAGAAEPRLLRCNLMKGWDIVKFVIRVLDKVDLALSKLENFICCFLIVVMACIIFLQIICRFAKFPLVWSEELGRFMFIWLIYFSVCVSTRRETHLCCDILPIILHDVGKIVVKIISNVLCLVFFIFVAYHGVGVIQKLIVRPQVSAAMQVNMIWAYIGPYVGAFIASIHYVILIVREIGELMTLHEGKEAGPSE